MDIFKTFLPLLVTASMVTACDVQENNQHVPDTKNKNVPPFIDDSALDVERFLSQTDKELSNIMISATQTDWVYNNFITDDTAALSANANQQLTDAMVNSALQAAKFDNTEVTSTQRRKLNILKQSIVMPAPKDSLKSSELADITAKLSGIYGKGRFVDKNKKELSLTSMTQRMAVSRDHEELLALWQGWRTVSPAMKPLFVRQTALVNEGAQNLGYQDLGVMWRANYDMPSSEFTQKVDRLWLQVKPLYDDLHCYVRNKLSEKYGKDNVSLDQPIPAHLLGNMWAQQWGNIYDLVAPNPRQTDIDLTSALKKHQYSELDMVKTAETFFTSLGFSPLPKTFWQRSLFTKPKDRDVVCHASAWNLDDKDDLRIKMCIEKTAEDFSVIHHELGHSFYQRAYKDHSIYFRGSANDGFHEAIGDTIALSITPKYLKQIGLINAIPDESQDISLLLKQALDKIAFLPFGLLVDKWRWQVYSGEITPENYNKAWWELREKYQGITAPILRSKTDFDPGAKYHVAAGVPYSRYFLAHILQFEFHKTLCEISGNQDPIHRCSIYGSKKAGTALNDMLTMGASEPWQKAYFKLTGKDTMDATAVIDYFSPLQRWLKVQNKPLNCGF